MTDPLLFYRQIDTLNQQILAALDAAPESLDQALRLLQERHTWMRPGNTPTLASEAPVRAALLPLMETILAQDEAIATRLAAHQSALGAELRSLAQARVSQGYQPQEGRPQPRFLDQAG